jgi:hypothetical protein
MTENDLSSENVPILDSLRKEIPQRDSDHFALGCCKKLCSLQISPKKNWKKKGKTSQKHLLKNQDWILAYVGRVCIQYSHFR